MGERGKRGPRGATGPQGPAGPAGFTPAYLSVYTEQNSTIPNGGLFRFVTSIGLAGIEMVTPDMHLGDDNATITVGTSGVYLVTVAVGPVGPVQLKVNGTNVGPNEASCGTSGTSVCAFQRILRLEPSAQIQLRNTSGNDENEEAGSGITIVRIA